jgi:hypothetical protein
MISPTPQVFPNYPKEAKYQRTLSEFETILGVRNPGRCPGLKLASAFGAKALR